MRKAKKEKRKKKHYTTKLKPAFREAAGQGPTSAQVWTANIHCFQRFPASYDVLLGIELEPMSAPVALPPPTTLVRHKSKAGGNERVLLGGCFRCEQSSSSLSAPLKRARGLAVLALPRAGIHLFCPDDISQGQSSLVPLETFPLAPGECVTAPPVSLVTSVSTPRGKVERVQTLSCVALGARSTSSQLRIYTSFFAPRLAHRLPDEEACATLGLTSVPDLLSVTLPGQGLHITPLDALGQWVAVRTPTQVAAVHVASAQLGPLLIPHIAGAVVLDEGLLVAPEPILAVLSRDGPSQIRLFSVPLTWRPSPTPTLEPGTVKNQVVRFSSRSPVLKASLFRTAVVRLLSTWPRISYRHCLRDFFGALCF